MTKIVIIGLIWCVSSNFLRTKTYMTKIFRPIKSNTKIPWTQSRLSWYLPMQPYTLLKFNIKHIKDIKSSTSNLCVGCIWPLSCHTEDFSEGAYWAPQYAHFQAAYLVLQILHPRHSQGLESSHETQGKIHGDNICRTRYLSFSHRLSNNEREKKRAQKFTQERRNAHRRSRN